MNHLQTVSRIRAAVMTAALCTCTLAFAICPRAVAPEEPAETEVPAVQDENPQDNGEDSSKYIYLAGPFFNEEEVANVKYAESVLDEKGLTYFSPMRHKVDAKRGTSEWAHKIFEMDQDEIDKADVVVALYYGGYSDSGTAWECGYAAAIGVPVVLVHIDDEGTSNLMMHCGCYSNIDLDELEDYDFDAMPVYEYKGIMF